MVIDVRPPAEYAAGQLPDAVNIPPGELEARLADLPVGRPVVAYCRGPLCAYADTAVRALAAAGRPALRLVDGLPEWAAAGAAGRGRHRDGGGDDPGAGAMSGATEPSTAVRDGDVPLLQHADYDAPSVFQPANLLGRTEHAPRSRTRKRRRPL